MAFGVNAWNIANPVLSNVVPANTAKNLIINGNFDIWQRGIFQNSVNGYGSDDRWLNSYLGSTIEHIQLPFTLGQTSVPNNPTYYSSTAVTSVIGAANYARKHYRIEGVHTFSGKEITLSFWAKADTDKNIAVEFSQAFGTGGAPSVFISALGVTTFALTSTWKKYTVTTTLPSILDKILGTDNNNFIQLIFWFDAGSDNNSRTNSLGQQSGTFDIAQVQLESGSIATDFETRSISQELLNCQRYYYKTSNYLGELLPYDSENTGAKGVSSATTKVYRCSIDHPVEMRDTPTVSFSGVELWDGVVQRVASAIANNNSSKYVRSIDWTTVGNMGGVGLTAVEFTKGVGSYIDASAEL